MTKDLSTLEKEIIKDFEERFTGGNADMFWRPGSGAKPKDVKDFILSALRKQREEAYSKGRQEAIEEAVSSLTELHCLCGDKTKHCKGLTVVLDQLKTK